MPPFGAGPYCGRIFLKVVLKTKRFLSFFVTLALLFSLVPSPASANPAALSFVVSAFTSYVAGAGFSWRFESGEDSAGLQSAITGLWQEYSGDNNLDGLEALYSGIGISSAWGYILSKSVSLQFNGFLTWLKNTFNLSAGSTGTVVQGGTTIGGYHVLWVPKNVAVYPLSNSPKSYVYGNGVPVYMWRVITANSRSIRLLYPAPAVERPIGIGRNGHGGNPIITGQSITYNDEPYIICTYVPSWSSSLEPDDWYAGLPDGPALSAGEHARGQTSKSVQLVGSQTAAIPNLDAITDDDVVVVSDVVGADISRPTTAEGLGDIAISGALAGTLEPSIAVSPAVDVPAIELPPSLADYNLSDLGAALTDVFPFCIPWDVVEIIQTLNATPQAPYFSVDLFEWLRDRRPDLEDTDFTLDLGQSQYTVIGTVSRWATTIGFCLVLLVATKRLIWTTGG